ncbi:MAG: polyhydroxyalkanoate synthesis regulator DNA-binding domain-containing protein [Anaerolineales bacterium]
MPVIIKRYRNRKLYNTQSKCYITLGEIEELVKEQEKVKIIDNITGNDITAITLSQIIFELEKNRAGFLPSNLLLSLVQSGGKRIEEIRQNIFNSLNLIHHFDVEIERRVNLLIRNGELSQEVGTQLLGKLLSVSYREEDIRENVEGRIIELLRERQIPTKNDIQTLINKIETLSNRVERLNVGGEHNEESEIKTQIIK